MTEVEMREFFAAMEHAPTTRQVVRDLLALERRMQVSGCGGMWSIVAHVFLSLDMDEMTKTAEAMIRVDARGRAAGVRA